MTQTKVDKQVTIRILSPEDALRAGVTQIRADQLPRPKNVFTGAMQILQNPEPVTAKKKFKKDK